MADGTADSFEQEDWVRTGVAAAMLRSLDDGSLEAIQAVANLLTQALPHRTKVEYKGLLAKKLAKVAVTLGDDVLTIELDPSGGIVASRVHMSRGIALKREEWPLAEWVDALVSALEAKAESDDSARRALSNWLGKSP